MAQGAARLALLIVLAHVAGMAWVATRAFMRPDGIYLKSLLGFLGVVAFAAVVWLCASPFLSNEAGLGALIVFLMVVAAAGIAAAVACASATLRYVFDAWT